jgi:hypothetical protein
VRYRYGFGFRIREKHHRVILATSTAFFDAYLKGDPDARAWLVNDKVNEVKASKDQWHRK